MMKFVTRLNFAIKTAASLTRQASMASGPPADVSVLAESLTFPTSKRVAKNRLLKAALSERISTFNPNEPEASGIPTERLINLYDKWGHGGFGVILTSNVMVDSKNLEAPGNIIAEKGIDSSERREAFKRLAKVSKSDGALAIAQIGHAGRQTSILVNPHPYSASDVQLRKTFNGVEAFGVPVPLTEEQIKTEVTEKFAYTAHYCADAGFDGVEIHAAHGYLLSQFISPTTNKRTDRYGGSPENRSRIVFEVYNAIRNVVPKDFVVGVKLNSVEFQKDGLLTEDATRICELMDEAGFDFIELSGGTMEHLAFSHQRESTRKREAFFLDFSDQIVKRVKKSVIYVTGGFRTAKVMVSAVVNGSTQGVGLGRPTTQEPDIAKKILSKKSERARKVLLDQDDFTLTLYASIAQMAQAGASPFRGDPCEGIMDLGDEDTVTRFKGAVNNHLNEMFNNLKNGVAVADKLEFDPRK